MPLLKNKSKLKKQNEDLSYQPSRANSKATRRSTTSAASKTKAEVKDEQQNVAAKEVLDYERRKAAGVDSFGNDVTARLTVKAQPADYDALVLQIRCAYQRWRKVSADYAVKHTLDRRDLILRMRQASGVFGVVTHCFGLVLTHYQQRFGPFSSDEHFDKAPSQLHTTLAKFYDTRFDSIAQCVVSYVNHCQEIEGWLEAFACSHPELALQRMKDHCTITSRHYRMVKDLYETRATSIFPSNVRPDNDDAEKVKNFLKSVEDGHIHELQSVADEFYATSNVIRGPTVLRPPALHQRRPKKGGMLGTMKQFRQLVAKRRETGNDSLYKAMKDGAKEILRERRAEKEAKNKPKSIRNYISAPLVAGDGAKVAGNATRSRRNTIQTTFVGRTEALPIAKSSAQPVAGEAQRTPSLKNTTTFSEPGFSPPPDQRGNITFAVPEIRRAKSVPPSTGPQGHEDAPPPIPSKPPGYENAPPPIPPKSHLRGLGSGIPAESTESFAAQLEQRFNTYSTGLYDNSGEWFHMKDDAEVPRQAYMEEGYQKNAPDYTGELGYNSRGLHSTEQQQSDVYGGGQTEAVPSQGYRVPGDVPYPQRRQTVHTATWDQQQEATRQQPQPGTEAYNTQQRWAADERRQNDRDRLQAKRAQTMRNMPTLQTQGLGLGQDNEKLLNLQPIRRIVSPGPSVVSSTVPRRAQQIPLVDRIKSKKGFSSSRTQSTQSSPTVVNPLSSATLTQGSSQSTPTVASAPASFPAVDQTKWAAQASTGLGIQRQVSPKIQLPIPTSSFARPSWLQPAMERALTPRVPEYRQERIQTPTILPVPVNPPSRVRSPLSNQYSQETPLAPPSFSNLAMGGQYVGNTARYGYGPLSEIPQTAESILSAGSIYSQNGYTDYLGPGTPGFGPIIPPSSYGYQSRQVDSSAYRSYGQPSTFMGQRSGLSAQSYPPTPPRPHVEDDVDEVSNVRMPESRRGSVVSTSTTETEGPHETGWEDVGDVSWD